MRRPHGLGFELLTMLLVHDPLARRFDELPGGGGWEMADDRDEVMDAL